MGILKYADVIGCVQEKRCYQIQIFLVDSQLLPIAADVLSAELKGEAKRIRMCNSCANCARQGSTPTQAYWNNMFLDVKPEALANKAFKTKTYSLANIWKRLLNSYL